MKVLVTGGTGHLGRAVVALLKANGRDVRVLARRPGADPRVEWVRGDLATEPERPAPTTTTRTPTRRRRARS
jgi:uncharacterized protein YbjT (DUF2867 family)